MGTQPVQSSVASSTGTLAVSPVEYQDPSNVAKLLPRANVLIVLDYDGTLREFVPNPNDAIASRAVVDTLNRICSMSDVVVSMVSGRSVDNLKRMLGPIPVRYYGSHGNEHGWGHEQHLEQAIPVAIAQSLEAAAKSLEDGLSQELRAAGVIIEQKPGGVAVHWRKAPQHAEQAQLIAVEAHQQLNNSFPGAFEIQPGDMVAEIKPCAKNKGDALLDAHKKAGSPQYVICIGDDHTDRKMMEAMARQFGASSYAIMVGERLAPIETLPAENNLRLQNPAAVLTLLNEMFPAV